jgi:murein L,D-transpeptidase YcbB/YkuD
MKRHAAPVVHFALVFALLLIRPATLSAGTLIEEASRHIEQALEPFGLPVGEPDPAEGGAVDEMVRTLYRERNFLPVWFTESGPVAEVDAVLGFLSTAESEGLRPEFYRTREIEAALSALGVGEYVGPEPREVAEVDLMLSTAFIGYSSDLLTGRVNPAAIEGEWSGNSRDFPDILKNIGSGSIEETLQTLLPKHEAYTRLKLALASYRRIAASGGWREVPGGDTLKKGFKGERVVILKERLAATGDLEAVYIGGDDFDEYVERAVAAFQMRHGIEADGIVGAKTLEALNVSVKDRIRQIELNMERWRWLPESLGEHYIVVNSADFSMEVFEKGVPILSMRIVVGKPFWHTPSFSSVMTYLVLNPSWNVPRNITFEELLPKIQEDPTYLETHGYQVLTGWGEEEMEIDPGTVNWGGVTRENIWFRLRQRPGVNNPLGRIKFMFPNEYDIYMHDTPAKGLFSLSVRTFSHGCIRIEKPMELALYLLRENPGWDPETLEAALEDGKEQTVRLNHPVRVHLLYRTAWADEDGTVNFREDIYGLDGPLEEALFGNSETLEDRY